MRAEGTNEAELYVNHPNGTCGMCHSNTPTLLEEGSVIRVIPPDDATPKRYWHHTPTTRVGNSRSPFIE